MLEFNSRTIRLSGNVWDVAVEVPKSIVEKLDLKKDRRVVCSLNSKHSFQCALMHKGDGNYFINLNKANRTKLSLELGDHVTVELKTNDSKYGLPLPEELASAWEIDQEAFDVFHSLTLGKQRSLIHIVGKLKSGDKRIEKALVMLEYLKSVNGKLDFKELNEAFKLANRK